MHLSPVSLYLPSHSPWISFARPLRLTAMMQGEEAGVLLHVKYRSSSYPFVSKLKNFQSLAGGMVGSSPTFAFRSAEFPSSPTSHSLPDLLRRKTNMTFPTCTEESHYHLALLLSEPVYRPEIYLSQHLAQTRTCPYCCSDGFCWHHYLTARKLQIRVW